MPDDSPLVRLHRLFDVRAGEGTPILYLMGLSLCAGMFTALFFTAASASFLGHFEIRVLPEAYLVSALVGGLATGGFSFAGRRLRLSALVVRSLVGIAALLLVCWLGLRFVAGAWVSFVVFVLVDPLFTLVDLGFWSLAGRLFDLQQAKRLSGLVSSGEVVSAIAGFSLVPALLRIGSLPLLVLAAAGAAGACALIASLAARRFAAALDAGEESSAKGAEPVAKVAAGDRRYVRLICALVVLTVATLYFTDFSLLNQVRLRFATAEAVGRFLALYWGATRGLELIVKSILSGRLIGHLGLLFGLVSLPGAVLLLSGFASVGLVGGTATSLFFVLVAVVRLVEFVFRRALFEPSLKVLFQPLGERLRFTVQTRVDGPVRQLGLLVAGGALLLIVPSPTLGVASVVSATAALALAGVATTFLVFREYRQKLRQALATRGDRVLLEPPTETIRRTLTGADPSTAHYGFEVLLRLDPELAHELVGTRLADADPAARLEALDCVRRNLMVPLLPAIEARAAYERDPRLRRAAEAAREALREIAQMARSPEQIERVAAADTDRDRIRAALALARCADPALRKTTLRMLWDRNPQVRRIALVAAGRSGRSEYLPRIVEHLPAGAFCQSAVVALAAAGESALPALDTAFSRFADRPDVLLRALRALERLGGEAAQHRLFARIDHPDHDVQRQALRSLSTTGFRAREFQIPLVRSKIEQSIGRIAWTTAALRDLASRRDLAAVTAALDEQLGDERDSLFLLLGLICEPEAVRMIEESVGSAGGGGRGYALEIADEVTPKELHPLLLPFFEGLGPGHLLDRLALYFPQRRLSADGRLDDLLGQGYDRVNTWTRACAVAALAADAGSGTIPEALVANLFHPDPMVRELVVVAMRRRDPDRCRRLLGRLPAATAGDLERVAGEREGRRLRVFERVNLLRRTGILTKVPAAILAGLAHDLVEVRLRPDEQLFAQGEAGQSMYVVAEGSIRISRQGAYVDTIGAREVLGEMAALAGDVRTASAHAAAPTRLLEIDRDRLLLLLADHLEVLPGLLAVISARLAEPEAAAA